MYPWLLPTLKRLQQRALHDQLHHGLLFVADNGVGESLIIESMVKSLLCSSKSACGNCKSCKLFEAKSHPDMMYVVSDKPSIGVDLIRQVSDYVTTTSQMLGNKVIVIENIELMTEAASNSLLKTLEEPNKNTYLLLTTTRPNSLLATVTSRCEKVRLVRPSISQSLAWLGSQTSVKVSEEGLNAFSGSPLDYLASLTNESANYDVFCHDIASLVSGNISELLLAEKCKTNASLVLLWTYQKAILMYKKRVEADNNTNPAQAQTLDRLVLDCQQANKKISQAGINKSLILQHIFHTFKVASLAQ